MSEAPRRSDEAAKKDDGGLATSGPSRVVISKRLVVINAASSIGAKLLNASVLVWTYQYLIKSISIEEFAVYPIVMAIMVFAPLFFTIFSGGVGRHLIDAFARGDEAAAVRVLSSIWPALMVAALVLIVVGSFFAAHIDSVLNIAPEFVNDAQIMTLLLFASLSVRMIGSPFLSAYFVHQRFVELNGLQMAKELLRLLILLALLQVLGPRVLWVVVATVIAEVAYFLITSLRGRQMLPTLRFDRHAADMKQARALMSFGIWTTLGQLSNIMYAHAATVVLNLYGTALDVANYFIGAAIYRQLQGMITTAVIPLQPAITAMNALEDRTRLANTVLRGGRYGLWVAMAAATPLLVFADEFISLYLGPKMDQASTILILMMLIFPFTQPTALLPTTAVATAKVRAFFLPSFLFQCVAIGLMVFCASTLDMGAVGVTLALAAVTIASQVAYFMPLCLRMIEGSWRTYITRVLVPGLLPALAGALAWSALKFTVDIDGWVELFVVGAIGGLCYVGTLLGLCLDASERRDISASLNTMRLALR